MVAQPPGQLGIPGKRRHERRVLRLGEARHDAAVPAHVDEVGERAARAVVVDEMRNGLAGVGLVLREAAALAVGDQRGDHVCTTGTLRVVEMRDVTRGELVGHARRMARLPLVLGGSGRPRGSVMAQREPQRAEREQQDEETEGSAHRESSGRAARDGRLQGV